jgi:hypothetical protein
MPTLPFQNVEHLVYEHQSAGKLVAVEKEESEKIKDFFKKYKGKKVQPAEKVKGFWFVLDEEHNSLKIDFSQVIQIEIKELVLFPLK